MSLRDVGVEAALAAGRILAEHSGRVQVRHKGAVDLVTQVDLACEAAIRAVLEQHTPDVPVLAEEGGGSGGTTRWIVDPLDGTTNFVHGFPWYCVSVALQVDGVLEVGVIHEPIRGRTYTAVRGQGAFCGSERLRVSAVRTLDEALLATGFPYDRRDNAASYLPRIQAAMEAGQGLRRAGSAALDLTMVATGALDGFWEQHLKPWDVAAGALLVAEAGGIVEDLEGGPLRLGRPWPLASNGWLQDELRALLQPSG